MSLTDPNKIQETTLCLFVRFRRGLIAAMVFVSMLSLNTLADEGKSTSQTDERLAEYILNESTVNDGYVVYFRLQILEDIGVEHGLALEQMGRIVRRGNTARVDQQYSNLIRESMTAQPVFFESSLRSGRKLQYFSSLDNAIGTFDPDDEAEVYKSPGLRAKLIDPMMFVVCTYGDFLKGPEFDWPARMFGGMEELAAVELPQDRVRAIYVFPKTGAGALVVTYGNQPNFLPETFEWKLSPGAKRVNERPSAEEAFRWSTTDVGQISWVRVDSNWVPRYSSHLQTFGGRERRYRIDFVNWSFEKQEIDRLLDDKTFKEDRERNQSMEDFLMLFDTASQLFPQ